MQYATCLLTCLRFLRCHVPDGPESFFTTHTALQMTWTVEPEAVIVPEPLVMFCVLLEDAFHQLSSLAYAKH